MRPVLACSFAFALLAASSGAQVRPGPWPTAGKVPEGWVVHNTRNYHVQSECGMDKAKRLGDHMEVMNALYRRMFKPGKDGSKAQTIKLFKDDASFRAYGAPAMAAAYYSYDDREMVCYDTGKWMDDKQTGPITGPGTDADKLKRRLERMQDRFKMDLLGCAAHEGWHQYYHWLVVSRVQLPSWINEGMGDYFYAAAPRDRKRKEADVGLLNAERGPIIKAALRQDRMEPLPKFLGMLQNDYYSNPGVCYAQGWALCQFLLHGENGKYAKIIPNYVKGLCNDTNWESVQAKAFKGFDLALMEKEFKAYIGALKSSEPDPFEEMAEGDPVVEPPAPPPAEPPTGEPPAPQPPAPQPPAPNEPPKR